MNFQTTPLATSIHLPRFFTPLCHPASASLASRPISNLFTSPAIYQTQSPINVHPSIHHLLKQKNHPNGGSLITEMTNTDVALLRCFIIARAIQHSATYSRLPLLLVEPAFSLVQTHIFSIF